MKCFYIAVPSDPATAGGRAFTQARQPGLVKYEIAEPVLIKLKNLRAASHWRLR
ncbi:MAG TPA: hypothetical protein VMV04_21555 [Thermodesulfobacteriota bacterium]|nr:hypothetical protein [Thermodesulfobacteriota bacterium]